MVRFGARITVRVAASVDVTEQQRDSVWLPSPCVQSSVAPLYNINPFGWKIASG